MSFRISSWKKKNSLYNVSSSLCHSLSLPKVFLRLLHSRKCRYNFWFAFFIFVCFLFCFIIFEFLYFIVETCTTLRLNCSSFDVANVLQCKVLDFVSNFLLVVVVAMWNAFSVAEKGREAVEEGGEEALLMRLTMIVMMVRWRLSVVPPSPLSLCLPRCSSHYGILTQPTLSPYTCSSFSPSLPPSLSFYHSLCVSSYLANAIEQRRCFIARTARVACQFRAYSCSRCPVTATTTVATTVTTTTRRNNYPLRYNL